MKPTVVIGYGPFGDYVLEDQVLASIDANVLHFPNVDSAEARAAIKDADALMVTTQQVPASLIATMERCKVISRAGTGLDAIDIPAATQKGVWVAYVPDYSIDEVSTHALALILAHARQIPRLVDSTRKGQWNYQVVPPIQRFNTQTLGIAGFGRIGRALGQKAKGAGLDVIVYDPYLSADAVTSAGAKPVDLDTLLRTSDYISLHMPLLDSTRNMIDAAAFAKMKPTAFIVNAARGGLIDEDALLQAIRNGQIAGAAIDVLVKEPIDKDNPLLKEDKIWITPHVGWYSEAAREDVRIRAADEVVRVWKGETPRCPVNKIGA